MPKKDPRVDKRRVTMTSYSTVVDADGKVGVQETKAVDYVRPDFLDAYLATARANWQHVDVSDETDAGPGGYDGATHVPDTLDHPLAGQTFAANTED